MTQYSSKLSTAFAYLGAIVFSTLLTGYQTAVAQTYPSKPITVVVPYGPGTGNDIIARIIAQKVSETSGQPMVIDNRAGANGSIGINHARIYSELPDCELVAVYDANKSYAERAAAKYGGKPCTSLEEFAALYRCV